MAHMRPETWYGGMWICEDTHGEGSVFPEDVFSQEQAAEQCGVEPEDVSYEKGWWARLSAPGYMDQTEWSGPFKTQKLALDYLYSLYDVDASGDDRSEGWEMRDDLDDEDEGDGGVHMRGHLHGLAEAPRNKKVHNLFQQPDGRWVFRFGPTPFRFENEDMFFTSRGMAIQTALRNGWVVEDDNRMRRVHKGGLSG